MNDLVSAIWVAKWVNPDLNAIANVRKRRIADYRTKNEEQKGEYHVAQPSGCNIDHYNEEGKEEDSAAKVSLEDNDHEAYAPHHKYGREHLWFGKSERSDASRRSRKELSVFG